MVRNTSFHYQLPIDLLKRAEVKTRVLDCIPSNWNSMEGILYAPMAMYEGAQVASGTRLVLSRDVSKPLYKGVKNDESIEDQLSNEGIEVKNEQEKQTPYVNYDVVFKSQFPSSVEFHKAGLGNPALDFVQALKIAKYFIMQRYGGSLQIGLIHDLQSSKCSQIVRISDYDNLIEIWWNNNIVKDKTHLERIVESIEGDSGILEGEMMEAAHRGDFDKAILLRTELEEIKKRKQRNMV